MSRHIKFLAKLIRKASVANANHQLRGTFAHGEKRKRRTRDDAAARRNANRERKMARLRNGTTRQAVTPMESLRIEGGSPQEVPKLQGS